MFFSSITADFLIFFIIYPILYSLIVIICILIAVAYFTLLDRKVMASMQRRRGPNVVGIWGLLKHLSDGLKLLIKESIIPVNANNFLFILAPLLTFVLSLVN
jgi:NADH-quinone oxidoreductase subunit H